MRLADRIEIFQDNLIEHSKLAAIKFSPTDSNLARFLYYHFWFPMHSLDFESEIAGAIATFREDNGDGYGHGFGRMHQLLSPRDLVPRDALHIAEGIGNLAMFRPVALALIAEYTRTSRLQMSIRSGSPISLGDYNLVLAALRLTPDELALHRHLVEKIAPGEKSGLNAICAMVSCQLQANWLVVCPNGDGREFLCEKHKSEDGLTYDTFRLYFSASCGHHAERRDCRYVLVSRNPGSVELPYIGPIDS